MKTCYLLAAIILSSHATVFATSLTITQPLPTHEQISQTTLAADPMQTAAQSWGVSIDDYKRYLWLMQNTASGHWYKQLDPAEVLALNAKDDKAMMRYAKIQAQNTHMRITQELAFAKMYTQAYKLLYSHEKPVMPSISNAVLQPGDHVWLFTAVNTPLGRFVYQNISKSMQKTPDTVLDIYFVGKNLSQKTFTDWAVSVGIPPESVNKQVTLNYGNDRLNTITKSKHKDLPFVGIFHNGHFQVITLSSIL